jgi:hypothetical protein
MSVPISMLINKTASQTASIKDFRLHDSRSLLGQTEPNRTSAGRPSRFAGPKRIWFAGLGAITAHSAMGQKI